MNDRCAVAVARVAAAERAGGRKPRRAVRAFRGVVGAAISNHDPRAVRVRESIELHAEHDRFSIQSHSNYLFNPLIQI